MLLLLLTGRSNRSLYFLLNEVGDGIFAEPLEKLMTNKLVLEKKGEFEKKLESLRRKHEKERSRLQSAKGSVDGEKHKSKFYNNKLVKRLSTKNM